MRRAVFCFALCALMLAGFVGIAGAGWMLYDDFEAGFIDPNKWDVDDSSAVITVENGRAKFVHQPGFAGDNNWLIFKARREIRGIAATVRVQDCSGDVRGRLKIKKWVDWLGNVVYMHEDVQPWAGYIWARSGYWTTTGSDITRSYGRFMDTPMENVDHKLVLVTTENLYQAQADNLGSLLFLSPSGETLTLKENPFYGIGTRSTNGDGPCTVYFDDVYVLY